jgi:hypothetical protein
MPMPQCPSSQARHDSIVRAIYNGTLTTSALSRPHLVSVTPGAPTALVRRAVFNGDDKKGVLELRLTSVAEEGVRSVKLLISAPGGWQRNGATTKEGSFTMTVDVRANNTDVSVPFQKQASAAPDNKL